VDANGRLTWTPSIAYAKALVRMASLVRKAGDPLDYDLQAKLAPSLPPRLATGEDLFSLQDARNLYPLRGPAAGP